MKLREKILLPILLILIIGVGTLGFTSYNSAKKIILHQIYEDAENQLNTLSAMIKTKGFDENAFIDHLRLGKSGYGYIVDSHGKIISHPDANEEGIDLHDFEWGKTILEKGNGNFTYTYGGFEKYSTFKSIDGNIVVIAVPTMEFLQPLNTLKINTLIILLASIILSIIAITLLVNKVAIKPIRRLTGIMEEVGNGNLNANISIDSKDEIGEMSKHFNNMTENMKKIIQSVKSTVIEVTKTSEMIASTTEETTVASEEISKAIEEIASGASNQATEINNTLEVTNRLDKKVDNMIEMLKNASENAKNMENNNMAGIQSIADFKKMFESYSKGAKDLANNVYELSNKSETIGQIVQTINNISGQTNLLALNAAIEAARAGEAGRGFGVVADEIRKLAEQSEGSASEIQIIIEEIKTIINHTDEGTKDSEKLLEKSKITLTDTERVFGEISKSIEYVVNQVDILHRDIDDVDKIKDNVLNAMENIASVSQETAASTQEISASTEEQTAAMEEVAATVQGLDGMVNRLSKEIEIFAL